MLKKNKFLLFAFALMLLQNLHCQNVTYYLGMLKAGNVSLPITLRIENGKDTSTIQMGSPMQTQKMFAASKSKFTGDSVKFSQHDLSMTFRGKYSPLHDSITGTFRQRLMKQEIVFIKTDSLFTCRRPQTPQKPFPYSEKEITFRNPSSDYTFHGTLTLPQGEGPFPLLVLVSGSGAQNRDEEIFLHKPFAVIADYLSRRGVAVFRYDDRGFGSTDTLLYKGNTMDFAQDASCALDAVKNSGLVSVSRTSILGHSEGGIIAQILASQRKDIDFMVFMAAPAVSGREILTTQTEAIMRKGGSKEEEIAAAVKEVREADYSGTSMTDYWMRYFADFQPEKWLRKIKCPVLVLNGEKDVQVDCEKNMTAMKKHLKSRGSEFHALPGLNHLFQSCNTGLPEEYMLIEQTISPEVLQIIDGFIQKQTAEK